MLNSTKQIRRGQTKTCSMNALCYYDPNSKMAYLKIWNHIAKIKGELKIKLSRNTELTEPSCRPSYRLDPTPISSLSGRCGTQDCRRFICGQPVFPTLTSVARRQTTGSRRQDGLVWNLVFGYITLVSLLRHLFSVYYGKVLRVEYCKNSSQPIYLSLKTIPPEVTFVHYYNQ